MGSQTKEGSLTTYLEVFAPFVQNLLQHLVHFGIQERSVATGRCHSVVKNGTHRYADHANALSGVCPLRSTREYVVEDSKHMAIVPDGLVTRGVLVVGTLLGNLIPHLSEEHADARVGLDEGLELLQHRDELLGVLVDMLDLLVQPFLVDTAVRRQPCTRPEGGQQLST